MKLRKPMLAVMTAAALCAPTAASAADVHITIDLSHVQRDGVRKLKVAGELHDVGGGAACTDGRHVVVQRRKNSSSDWNNVGHDTTNSNGAYSDVVRDRQGQYRVVAPAGDGCERDTSSVVGHSH